MTYIYQLTAFEYSDFRYWLLTHEKKYTEEEFKAIVKEADSKVEVEGTIEPEYTASDDIVHLPEQIEEMMPENGTENSAPAAAVFGILLGGVILIVLMVLALALLLEAFLINPLEVGCRRFFVRNLHGPAEVKEAAFGYDHNYKNIVKTMFCRDIYLILWTLLFIIPGIIKSYEYRMIPYLLADHPEMTRKEAFAKSRELMRGQKWKTFVLDLSFILWDLLSLLTLGLLDIFYVGPYKHMTSAALYETLAYAGTAPETEEAWAES